MKINILQYVFMQFLRILFLQDSKIDVWCKHRRQYYQYP